MTSDLENKKLIRKNAAAVRANLSVDPCAGEHLSQSFFDIFSNALGEDDIISLYWPLSKECDTLPLIDDLLSQNIKCALPVVNEKECLDFYLWGHDKPLKQSGFGIMEPDIKSESYAQAVTPNIILLPLLAYDRKGNRLGYGAGHYDRVIEKLRSEGHDPLLVGVAYMEQICLYPLPAEDHDIPLHCVLNPNGYTRFSPLAPEG